MADYLIGIDLGTTNSTLSYAPIDDGEISLLPLEQKVLQDQLKSLNSLPSFYYFNLPEEGEGFTVGEFAKKRAVETPSRTAFSAKSWLSNKEMDPSEKILPWKSDLEEKKSPIEVLAAYLLHMKGCWNEAFDSAPFEDQKVTVTVPASFDPVCRQLVQEALNLAGYPETTLVEEPQAAFYSYLNRHEETWRKELQVGDSVAVIDIGGGTTDFCLISVSENEGALELNRIAVGEHLLLGGDNMDLALAYLAKGKLEKEGHTLDNWQVHQLTSACREAKEILLFEEAPETYEITVAGRGRSLIGGSLSVELTKNEVASFVGKGFFPLIPFETTPKEAAVSGFGEVGLPYARDARITAHLAAFFQQAKRSDDTFKLPTHILFNGGAMKADALRAQVKAQLENWAQELGCPAPKILEGEDLDFGVSRGAVAFNLAKEGKGMRIKAGLSHTYYVGIEEAALAIPGFDPQVKAVCVAPSGLEEGDFVELKGETFTLIVGDQAVFRFFSTPDPTLPSGELAKPGDVFPDWEGKLTALPPIETFLEKTDSHSRTVAVNLKAKLTELGVLELSCFNSEKEWKLELNARKQEELV